MKQFLFSVLTIFFFSSSFSQIDPFKAPVVYQADGMDKVAIQKGIPFKTINDTTLAFDVYYPPAFDKKSNLPVVVFNNGVGNDQLPNWRVYQDWAKLVAVNGMVAINHQARGGKSLVDTGDLIDYLRTNGAKHNIDGENIALWSCSANVTVAMPLAMQRNRKNIRALVMYYGAGAQDADNVVKRQDLEILLVRAGLDFHNLNKNIEKFMRSALQQDAHVEFINYPEGQHAFDVVDNTQRSKEIILQTIEFLKRTLAKEHVTPESFVLTNEVLWNMIMHEKKTAEALTEFKKAIAKYRATPGHTPFFNHIIDERNLNQVGYDLIEAKRNEDAILVFQANQEAFPDSPNVYDALGDAYEKAGDNTKALANARLALEKLEKAELPAQYKQAIRESADGKIKRLKG
jgi:dienelactone hydrolase